MKRTIIAAAMLLVFACGVLSAQGPGRQRSRRGGDTRMQQDSSEEWAKAQAELKKKYPEKYKEIEKLQATNLFAAMEKMRELASEASVTLPGSRRGNWGGRPGGMPGGMRMPGGMGMMGNMRNPRAAAEAELKAKYPAEYAEIEKQRILAENKLEELVRREMRPREDQLAAADYVPLGTDAEGRQQLVNDLGCGGGVAVQQHAVGIP